MSLTSKSWLRACVAGLAISEVQAGMSVRVTEGLSVGAELNASRVRDQLSLPARGASPEEIL